MCGLCEEEGAYRRPIAVAIEAVDAPGHADASPYGAGPASSVGAVGDARVDSLLAGTKWGGARGGRAEVEFSFAEYGSQWIGGYGHGEPANGFRPFNAQQEAAARKALQLWADVARIDFTEVEETATTAGQIRFGISSAPKTSWAYYPDRDHADGGDVWLGAGSHRGETDYSDGTYLYHTLIHELGHAIGLKHPHEDHGTGVRSSSDWQGVSVMSYRSFPGDGVAGGYSNDFFPTTPMLWDIKAAQTLYGANHATRAGNTTYDWNKGEQIFECIWDGGGRDLIDCSNQSAAVTISLAAGSWSRIGPAYTWDNGGNHGSRAETLSIAYGVTIENANGGSGDDRLIGNTAANLLSGNAGRDTLQAGNGVDTLDGGAGADLLAGGGGADRFVFDDGDAGTGSRRDRIADFKASGGDYIDLHFIDANANAAGDQAFAWKGAGSLSGAGQLGYYRAGINVVIRASTDGDAASEIEIQVAGSTTPVISWFDL